MLFYLRRLLDLLRVSYPLYFVVKDSIENFGNNSSNKENKILYIVRHAKSSWKYDVED